MDTLDVQAQAEGGNQLPTDRTFSSLVLVHLSDMSTQVVHGKFLFTERTRLLDLLMSVSHMPRKLINTDALLALRTLDLFTQMNTFNVVVQKLFGLEFLVTVEAPIASVRIQAGNLTNERGLNITDPK